MRPEEKAPGGGARGQSGAGACLICGKGVERDYRPFCSKRCADVDLNRWLNGAYRIAGPPIADVDDEASEP